MTPDREKLREDVARVLGVTHRGMDLVDAAIALIWPAAMREAADLERCVERVYQAACNSLVSEVRAGRSGDDWLDLTNALFKMHKATIEAYENRMLPPDAEKEEG